MTHHLADQIKKFRTKEPIAVGGGESSIPFLKLIPMDKKRVLVIGCGKGFEVKRLKEHGFEAIGVTNNKKEAEYGRKELGVQVVIGDMHEIPVGGKFDAIFASNVLEHSVAPFLALRHWRELLKKDGWLVLVMPSKEWTREYYHYSVLTHTQTKDLLQKAGFGLLAGPEMKAKFELPDGSDIFYDLGRLWGHFDGYVAVKSEVPVGQINKDNPELFKVKGNLVRDTLKKPYNWLRVRRARSHRD